MKWFKIKYRDPETEMWVTEHKGFEGWTGRSTLDGVEVGPLITISAKEWAEDYAYMAAGKGPYKVTECKQRS